MTVAEVGNIVEFYDGLRGRVEKINDNSVIVAVSYTHLRAHETDYTISYAVFCFKKFF